MTRSIHQQFSNLPLLCPGCGTNQVAMDALGGVWCFVEWRHYPDPSVAFWRIGRGTTTR